MSFPNLKNKHAHESVFSPKDFLTYQKGIGNRIKFKPPTGVIFCYSHGLIKHILGNHKTKKVSATNSFGQLYLISNAAGQVGIIANFGIGAPVATTILEELVALGVKRFISVGQAGTLQKNLKIKDIVVCSKAIRDEGTSHHYIKPSKYAYASRSMTARIEKALQELEREYTVGASWTIDAPYRETVAEARKYQKEGIATVEMEAAALFAVGQYRRVEVGAIFTISDSLAELKWEPKFHLSEVNWEILFQAAKRALLHL